MEAAMVPFTVDTTISGVGIHLLVAGKQILQVEGLVSRFLQGFRLFRGVWVENNQASDTVVDNAVGLLLSMYQT